MVSPGYFEIQVLAEVEAAVLVSAALGIAILLAIHPKNAYNVVLNAPMLTCMALHQCKSNDVSAKILKILETNEEDHN